MRSVHNETVNVEETIIELKSKQVLISFMENYIDNFFPHL